MTMSNVSRVKEAVATWGQIRALLRGGDGGQTVPVIIPKDRRGFGWLAYVAAGLYFIGAALVISSGAIRGLALLIGVALLGVAALRLWTSATIEVEQGTNAVLSRYGQIVGRLGPGRHYLWWPWDRVEYIVDIATEIPYRAPVLACPTADSVPLKAIEFFLTFRIEDPVAFVRTIGASNFDLVLSAAVQDAIRQRSRQVQTERAYELRGSDVGDMQAALNRQLERYGVRITGANIPDVQLPDQYQADLATREQVAKEQAAYAREWELQRKRQMDGLDLEFVRAQKLRDAKKVDVNAALNKAREAVARTIQEKQAEAERVQLQIESQGRARLTEAQNEAKGMAHLAQAYADNPAVLEYELATRSLEVAEHIIERAPRPVVVRTQGSDSSALSTLLVARMLPTFADGNGHEDQAMLTDLLKNGGNGTAPR